MQTSRAAGRKWAVSTALVATAVVLALVTVVAAAAVSD